MFLSLVLPTVYHLVLSRVLYCLCIFCNTAVLYLSVILLKCTQLCYYRKYVPSGCKLHRRLHYDFQQLFCGKWDMADICFLQWEFWNLGIWWLMYINRAINVIMIMVMIMTIIKIIIIVIIITILLLITKIMKIKIMLIRLILLRPSSSNKVKILDRNFISNDLILTYLFIRPRSPK